MVRCSFLVVSAWKSLGVGLTGRAEWDRNLAAREPLWEQKGLPSMFNMMQIASAKSHSARGSYHQSAFIGVCLTISHSCLPCLPSR